MNENNTLYFDGFCNLCSTWVKIIKRADRNESILFIPLQSDKGLLVLKNIGKAGEKLDTVIYEKDGHFFTYSDAVIECLTDLGGVWKVLNVIRCLPKSFRDLIYKFIARNRYRIFGKTDSCNTFK